MSLHWTVIRCAALRAMLDAMPFLMRRGDGMTVVAPEDWQPLDDHQGEPLPEILIGASAGAVISDPFCERLVNSDVRVYETENLLAEQSPWPDVRRWLNLGKRREWWNYSEVNARVHGDLHYPLVEQPLARWPPHRIYDVLHVGARHPRRDAVLNECRKQGLKVLSIGPELAVFGPELSAAIAASGVLLNIHFYLPGVFEYFRCVPAFSHGIPIVSEASLENEGAEFCRAMVPYDQLAATVADVVKQLREEERP